MMILIYELWTSSDILADGGPSRTFSHFLLLYLAFVSMCWFPNSLQFSPFGNRRLLHQRFSLITRDQPWRLLTHQSIPKKLKEFNYRTAFGEALRNDFASSWWRASWSQGTSADVQHLKLFEQLLCEPDSRQTLELHRPTSAACQNVFKFRDLLRLEPTEL